MGNTGNRESDNEWGVIHNQSNKDLIYILHNTSLIDQEALLKKGAGGEVGIDLKKGVDLSTLFTIQTHMQALMF